MQQKLLQQWNGMPAGRVIDVGEGVAQLLMQRKISEPFIDPDNDKKAEGGFFGQKKAFSSPQTQKSRQ